MIQTPEDNSAVPRAPLAASGATLVMGSMVRCDQMGIYDALGHMLRTHGHCFSPPRSRADGDGECFATLCHLRSRYLEARSLEARHGKGALLNLEHRDVATMLGKGQLLTDAEVGAARRFRDANPAFYERWREDAAMTPSASGNGPATWTPLGS